MVEHYPVLAEREQRTVVYLPLCHILGRDVAITLPLLSRPGAAFRRGRRGPAADPVRSGAHGALHRAALPAEVRLAGAGRRRQYVARQARGLRAAMRIGRTLRRARWDGESGLLQPASRASRRARSFSGRSSTSSASTSSSSSFQRRRTAAAGNDGAVADLGRQRRRDLRPDRGSRARSSAASAARSRGRATSAPCAGMGDRARRARARSWCAARHSSKATGAIRGDAGGAGRRRLAAYRRRRRMARRRRCASSTARAISSSPRAARPSRRPTSRTCCAQARTSPRSSVFGHARKYLTALIEIDFEAVADWARAPGRRATPASPASPSTREVEALIGDEIERANGELARVEQVKALPHPAEGARPGGGGRAGDADAQGEARADVPALRGAGGVDVRRPRRAAASPPKWETCLIHNGGGVMKRWLVLIAGLGVVGDRAGCLRHRSSRAP